MIKYYSASGGRYILLETLIAINHKRRRKDVEEERESVEEEIKGVCPSFHLVCFLLLFIFIYDLKSVEEAEEESEEEEEEEEEEAAPT